MSWQFVKRRSGPRLLGQRRKVWWQWEQNMASTRWCSQYRPQTRRSSANHPVADKRCHRSVSVRLYTLYNLPWAVLGWLRLSNYLQSPYYFMCCNLSDLHQDPRSPIGNPQLSNSQQQVLAGTLVSSLHRLKDIDNTGASNYRVHVLVEMLKFWPQMAASSSSETCRWK